MLPTVSHRHSVRYGGPCHFAARATKYNVTITVTNRRIKMFAINVMDTRVKKKTEKEQQFPHGSARHRPHSQLELFLRLCVVTWMQQLLQGV